MTRWPVLVLALVLVPAIAACGGGAPAKVTTPQPPTLCAHVADHLLSLMTDTAKEAPTEKLDATRRLFKDRCEGDAWSEDAQRCFMGLTTLKDGQRCAALLTEAQLQAIDRALAEASGPREETTGGAPPAGAPGPARSSSDPCEGGE